MILAVVECVRWHKCVRHMGGGSGCDRVAVGVEAVVVAVGDKVLTPDSLSLSLLLYLYMPLSLFSRATSEL